MKISVKVIPKSSENRVIGYEKEVLKVKCTAAPEKGKANDALIEILADHFNVPKRCIKIVRGLNTTKKIVEISSECTLEKSDKKGKKRVN